MLHSDEEFVIVADVLVIATHNQVIVSGLRGAALQLRGTRIACSKCDSRQASNVRTTSSSESVLSRADIVLGWRLPHFRTVE